MTANMTNKPWAGMLLACCSALLGVVCVSVVLSWGGLHPAALASTVARPYLGEYAFELDATTIGTSGNYVTLGLSTSLDCPLGPGIQTAAIEVCNVTTTGNVTGFVLQVKDHASGEWYEYVGTAGFAAWSATAGLVVLNDYLLWVSATGPHELTAATSTGVDNCAHFTARFPPGYGMRMRAWADAAHTELEVRGSIGRE